MDRPAINALKAVRLTVATSDTGKLLAAAKACPRGYFPAWLSLKKAGVTFLDLAAEAQAQGGLFDPPDDTRLINRTKAIDELNRRFGRGTAGERQVWSLRREFISPRYTTWEELLRV